MAAPSAGAQCLVSDDFSGKTYGPQWLWTWTNTGGQPRISTIPVTTSAATAGNYLSVLASGYSGADLWPYDTDQYGDIVPNFNATIILQAVNPNADWTVTTEIAGYIPQFYKEAAGLVLTTAPALSAGTQVWRVAEYQSAPPDGGPTYNQLAGYNYPTGTIINNSPFEKTLVYSSPVVYLQVQKSGSTYTVSYSADGVSYSLLYQDSPTHSFSYFGFSSINYPVPANLIGPYNAPFFHFFTVTNQSGC